MSLHNQPRTWATTICMGCRPQPKKEQKSYLVANFTSAPDTKDTIPRQRRFKERRWKEMKRQYNSLRPTAYENNTFITKKEERPYMIWKGGHSLQRMMKSHKHPPIRSFHICLYDASYRFIIKRGGNRMTLLWPTAYDRDIMSCFDTKDMKTNCRRR